MEKLSGSLEDYMETIYKLYIKNKEVRITDIAIELSLSKASVNRAVNSLQKSGLLNHEKYKTVTLTHKGKKIAQEVYFRHQTLLEFLVKILEIDPVIAEKDACRIEHVISNNTLNKLVKYLQYDVEQRLHPY